MNTDKASIRQTDFAAKLLAERLGQLQCSTVQEAAAKLHLDVLTKAECSVVIERLMAMPTDPDPTLPDVVAAAPRHGINGNAGPCATCKHVVDAGAGFYYGVKGAWSVHHKKGECSTAPVTTVTSTAADIEPGIYATDQGEYALIYVTGNQRLAGKALLRHGRYVYQPGLAMTIRSLVGAGRAHMVTAAEAAAYGAANAHCVACGRDLDDPRSDPNKVHNGVHGAGYGPVCAKKYGWPWGKEREPVMA